MERKIKKSEYIIIALIMLTAYWWSLALGYRMALSTEEKALNKMHNYLVELREIDKQKCIDLFSNWQL